MPIALIPQIVIRKITRSQDEAQHINVLASFFMVAGLFLCLDGLKLITSLPHFCLFEYATGVPCPGCDVTSALVALAQFHLYRSVVIQPCGLLLALTVLMQAIISAACLSRFVGVEQGNRGIQNLDGMFLVVLFLVWFFRFFNQ